MSLETDQYSWTKGKMPHVYAVADRLLQTTNTRVAVSLPLTWETLCLIDAIRSKVEGLVVIPQSSGENSSLQPGVFDYLERWGVKHARTASPEDRRQILQQLPDVIIDCSFVLGGQAVDEALLPDDTVIIEDTKTGENRMEAYDLNNPFIILDNSRYKREFENKEGIGYSVIAALASIGVYLPNYKVGVIGYGHVGVGVAKYARAMGAKDVVVCDIDPARRAEAEGLYRVMEKDELLREVDIVITATGREDVVSREDISGLDKRLILVNAGGEEEWKREALFEGLDPVRIHQHMIQAAVGNCTVQEVAGGNSANLAIGVSMSEFLDITFAHLISVLAQLSEIELKAGKNDLDLFDTSLLDELVA